MGEEHIGKSFGRRTKKKVSDESELTSEIPRAQSYRSIFDSSRDQSQQPEPKFFPPEALSANFSTNLDDFPLDLQNASSWDVATRYHEFKSKRSVQGVAKQLRRLSATAILERAQKVLGSVVHPMEQRTSILRDVPSNAEQPDLDLEETLENSPLAVASTLENEWTDASLTDEDIWITYQVHRHQPIILSIDTSLSMTGEKLALTAVALAVVLLEFPDDPIGIVAFENEAKVLKKPDERVSVEMLVERFLDVPAQGYTHLEEGMKAALTLARNIRASGQGKPASTVLLTDGKYTAGRDPSYLASRFFHLVVLKMGRERASMELCLDLAKKGKGVLREVHELESLPTIMYGVVKDLLRGRSIS